MKRKKYNSKKYNPSIGGHAQGHLRYAFLECLDLMDIKKVKMNTKLALDTGTPFTVGEIIGLLWNCTDILPNLYYQKIRDDFCGGLDFREPTRTYAAAARILKEHLS